MSCLNEEHHTVSGRKILLEIAELNSDNILITITNLSYGRDRNSSFKCIFILCLMYACYKAFIPTKIFIDFILIAAILLMIHRLFNTIQFESLTFINELGIQTAAKHFLGMKSSLFIPSSDIYDVVINEVIVDLKVIYLLIILTKGVLSLTEPIIPLFNGLRPNVDCLAAIYRTLCTKFRED